MVERHVVIPVAPAVLWEALTQPEQLGAWFGYQVEWDLRPGGAARWTRSDRRHPRCGVIDDVAPGRRLAYRWWPESGAGPASTVTYDLETPDNDPTSEATRLTVRETAIPRPEAGDSPVACASTAEGWSPWDTHQAGLWFLAQTTTSLVTV